MSFAAPIYLLGLLAVPVVVAGYVLVQRRRRGEAARFTSQALLPNLVDRAPGWRRHAPAAVLLLALIAMLVGLARPQAALSVPREEATVMLAVDTSESMAATDVKPSRLAAAKAAMARFVDAVPTKFRVGVVSFASQAQLAASPTQDRTLVKEALAQLRPSGGTALGDAIQRAIEAARAVPSSQQQSKQSRSASAKPPPTAILLVSDGKAEGGRTTPQRAAQLARSLGIPVYTVGIGTASGVVTVRHVGGYLERIQVPADPSQLKQIAAATNGRFFAAPTARALQAVYADLGSRLGHVKRKREITVAFAGGSAALLLIGGALSTLWFRRLP